MPTVSPTILQRKVSLAARIELERRKRRRDSSERLRKSFRDFIPAAWLIFEPAKPLIPTWHIDAIADHLQAVAEGQIRFLLVNIPPGLGKSAIASVCFSAWLWTRNPQIRILAGTYATLLTERDNIKTRSIVESDWYKDTFIRTLDEPKQWRLIKRNENHLQNDKSGFRMALSVDSVGTGLRGDGQILDDVLNAKEAYSAAARQAARRWVFETMSSRFDDMRKGWRVAIGQRLHEEDPYGEMLATGLYDHLCLPSEFEPKRRSVTSIGFTDPRQQPGELLFPELFTPEVIRQAKIDLGARGYAGQHQQRPAPAEGDMFKRHWFQYWKPKGLELPPVSVPMPDGSYRSISAVDLPDGLTQIQSWDMSFKGSSDSDFVVGQVWGHKTAQYFFLDQARGRWDFPETVRQFRQLTVRHPRASIKLVEDKANGSAVIATLKHEISGIIAVNPEGGKEARAAAVSPLVESGNVYLPHPAVAPWVHDFMEEVAVFNNGANDDMVDAFTQALTRLSTKQVYVKVLG